MPDTIPMLKAGDMITGDIKVPIGTVTEIYRLDPGQVVNSYGGLEPGKDRAGNLIMPGPQCNHCGKPSFAHDSLGRKYRWSVGDGRGCQCPLHPIGDGSDGGPISPINPEDRRLVAAEEAGRWTRRICELVECYLKANGVDVPPVGNAPAIAPATERDKPRADPARKAS